MFFAASALSIFPSEIFSNASAQDNVIFTMQSLLPVHICFALSSASFLIRDISAIDSCRLFVSVVSDVEAPAIPPTIAPTAFDVASAKTRAFAVAMPFLEDVDRQVRSVLAELVEKQKLQNQMQPQQNLANWGKRLNTHRSAQIA